MTSRTCSLHLIKMKLTPLCMGPPTGMGVKRGAA